MDWFYEYCSGKEFCLPPKNLEFDKFCVIFDVWFKTRYSELGEDAALALISQMIRRAKNVISPEQAVLFIHGTRKAVKRLGLVYIKVEKLNKIARELSLNHWKSEAVQLSFLKLARIARGNFEFGPPTAKDIVKAARAEDFLFVPCNTDVVRLCVWRQVYLYRPFPLRVKIFHLLFRDSELEMMEALDELYLSDRNSFKRLYSKLIEKELLPHEILLGDDERITKFLNHIANESFPLHVKQFHTLVNLKRES